MLSLNEISVKAKISLLTGVLLVALVVVAAFTVFQLLSIKSAFTQYSQSAVLLETTILEVNHDMNYVSRLTRSIMLGDDYQKNHNKLDQRISDISAHFDKLDRTADIVADESIKGQLKSLTQKSKKSTMTFLTESLRLMDTLSQQSTDNERQLAWHKYKKEFSPLANSSRTDFASLRKLVERNKVNIYQASEYTVESSLSVTTTISIVALIISLFLSLLTMKSIITPLDKLKGPLNELRQVQI